MKEKLDNRCSHNSINTDLFNVPVILNDFGIFLCRGYGRGENGQYVHSRKRIDPKIDYCNYGRGIRPQIEDIMTILYYTTSTALLNSSVQLHSL